MRNLFTSRILPPFNVSVALFILLIFVSNSFAIWLFRTFTFSPSVTDFDGYGVPTNWSCSYYDGAVNFSLNGVTSSVPALLGDSITFVNASGSFTYNGGCPVSSCGTTIASNIPYGNLTLCPAAGGGRCNSGCSGNCCWPCSGSLSCTFKYFVYTFDPELCSDSLIATIDSAYFTGTYANPPRYELYKLPSNCPKTVIRASQRPDSFFPWIDTVLNEQLNVAVSLDQNGNFATEGWSNDFTQAIFVPGNQTMEQLGCETNEEGYFVFCSDVDGSKWENAVNTGQLGSTGGGTITSGGLDENGERLPPDRIDTVVFFSPNNPPTNSNVSNMLGALGLTVQNGFNSVGKSFDELLHSLGDFKQTVSNGIKDVKESTEGLLDFFKDLFKPQDDPHTPNDNLYNVDDPTIAPEIELPPEYKVDTIIKYDSLSMEDEDIFPDLEAEFKKKLDSIKTPDKDSIKNELIKNQEKQLNETFDKIVDKVNKAMEPVYKALPKGDGACNCLADSFMNLSFGVMKGTVTVGSMVNTKIICENISIIRRIIMVIVAITCLGMILATLRR